MLSYFLKCKKSKENKNTKVVKMNDGFIKLCSVR